MFNDSNIQELHLNGIIKFRINKDISSYQDEYLAEINKCLALDAKGISQLGGFIAGHLNFYEQKIARKIYFTLVDEQLEKYIKKYLNTSFLKIRSNANLNFPNSKSQHWHFDGSYNNKFLILNVPIISITSLNGPTEIYKRSQSNTSNIRKFIANYDNSLIYKVNISRDECILRDSRLWHRGTPNKSKDVRPMLAFIFERSENDNNYLNIPCHDNSYIYNNMYNSTFIGKVKEYLLVYLPILNYVDRFFFKNY